MNVTWRSAAGIVAGIAVGVGPAFFLKGTVAPDLFEDMGSKSIRRIRFYIVTHPIERRWEILTIGAAAAVAAAGILADWRRQRPGASHDGRAP